MQLLCYCCVAGLVWLHKTLKRFLVNFLTNSPIVPKNGHLKSLKSAYNAYYQHYIVKCFTKFFVYRTQKNCYKWLVFCVFSQYACFNMAWDFVLIHKKNTKNLWKYTKIYKYTCIQYYCIHVYNTRILVYTHIYCIQYTHGIHVYIHVYTCIQSLSVSTQYKWVITIVGTRQ